MEIGQRVRQVASRNTGTLVAQRGWGAQVKFDGEDNASTVGVGSVEPILAESRRQEPGRRSQRRPGDHGGQ